MSKFLKFIVILSVALTVLFNYSYTFAAVDMNLGNTTTSSSTNSSGNTTTSSTISAYETGKVLIQTSFAIHICSQYNVSLDWLCGRK